MSGVEFVHPREATGPLEGEHSLSVNECETETTEDLGVVIAEDTRKTRVHLDNAKMARLIEWAQHDTVAREDSGTDMYADDEVYMEMQRRIENLAVAMENNIKTVVGLHAQAMSLSEARDRFQARCKQAFAEIEARQEQDLARLDAMLKDVKVDRDIYADFYFGDIADYGDPE